MDVDLRQRGDALKNVHRFSFDRAHAAHPGVDFEIDQRFADAVERLRFVECRDRWNEAALDDRRHFFRKRRTEDDRR